jgi:hypothetical protein
MLRQLLTVGLVTGCTKEITARQVLHLRTATDEPGPQCGGQGIAVVKGHDLSDLWCCCLPLPATACHLQNLWTLQSKI